MCPGTRLGHNNVVSVSNYSRSIQLKLTTAVTDAGTAKGMCDDHITRLSDKVFLHLSG